MGGYSQCVNERVTSAWIVCVWSVLAIISPSIKKPLVCDGEIYHITVSINEPLQISGRASNDVLITTQTMQISLAVRYKQLV